MPAPPVIARIRGNALLIDARTVRAQEIKDLVRVIAAALSCITIRLGGAVHLHRAKNKPE